MKTSFSFRRSEPPSPKKPRVAPKNEKPLKANATKNGRGKRAAKKETTLDEEPEEEIKEEDVDEEPIPPQRKSRRGAKALEVLENSTLVDGSRVAGSGKRANPASSDEATSPTPEVSARPIAAAGKRGSGSFICWKLLLFEKLSKKYIYRKTFVEKLKTLKRKIKKHIKILKKGYHN